MVVYLAVNISLLRRPVRSCDDRVLCWVFVNVFLSGWERHGRNRNRERENIAE